MVGDWLVFQRFLYRQLIYYVAIKSTLTAIRGTIVGWGTLERKATVPMGGGRPRRSIGVSLEDRPMTLSQGDHWVQQ